MKRIFVWIKNLFAEPAASSEEIARGVRDLHNRLHGQSHFLGVRIRKGIPGCVACYESAGYYQVRKVLRY